MIRLLLSISLLCTGCIPKSFIMEDLPDDLPDEEYEDDAIRNRPVTPMHWACCSDLCRGYKRVVSVTTEIDTPYINCICKNGKHFRVTKTKDPTKKK